MARAPARPTVGNRRARLLLQQEGTGVPDDAGGYTQTWLDVATVWAEVEPMRGQEIVLADKLAGVTTHRVKIRYRADVNAAWRAKLGTRVLNIRGVTDIEGRRRDLELICEEGPAT